MVDDGSTDGTAQVATQWGASLPNLRLISYGENRGKGHAVRVGILEAKGRVRLMYDADGAMPAAEVPWLVEPILENQADVVLGSRYTEDARNLRPQPLWRVVWSRVANGLIQRRLLPGILDTQCGYKAFSAQAAEFAFSRALVDGWAFDLEVLALCQAQGYRLIERGITWQDDEASKVRPLRDLIGLGKDLQRLEASLQNAPSPS